VTTCPICGGRLPDNAGGRKYCSCGCAVEAQRRSRIALLKRKPQLRKRYREANKAGYWRRKTAAKWPVPGSARYQAAFDRAVVRWLLSPECLQFICTHTAPFARGA